MTQEVTSKTEFAALSTKLNDEVSTLSDDVNSIKSEVNKATNYDGLNISSAARKINTRLANIVSDMEQLSSNIKQYIVELEDYDVDDFNSSDLKTDIEIDSELENINNEVIQNSSSTQNKVEDVTTDTNTNTGNTSVNTTPNNNSSNNNSTNNNSNNSSSNNTVYVPDNSSNNNNNSSNNNSSNNNTSNNSTSNTGNASGDITEPTVIKPTGQTSSNGRTKRSAKEDIIIAPGDPNDPNIDISKYHNNIEKGFEVTTGNLTYQLCEEDIELLCAIVSAESDKTYDDALAVMTTILNRCETSNWISSHGRDPIAQATAPNQFVVYQHGSYEGYMNGKAPETVKQAVMDALAGVRNHNYCSFRSNGSTSYSNNMISPTGNRYK